MVGSFHTPGHPGVENIQVVEIRRTEFCQTEHNHALHEACLACGEKVNAPDRSLTSFGFVLLLLGIEGAC